MLYVDGIIANIIAYPKINSAFLLLLIACNLFFLMIVRNTRLLKLIIITIAVSALVLSGFDSFVTYQTVQQQKSIAVAIEYILYFPLVPITNALLIAIIWRCLYIHHDYIASKAKLLSSILAVLLIFHWICLSVSYAANSIDHW